MAAPSSILDTLDTLDTGYLHNTLRRLITLAGAGDGRRAADTADSRQEEEQSHTLTH